jgi:hypothetical protein
MDKIILSAGFGCDMTFFNEQPDGEAFIHHVNGQWIFDRKVYWAWLWPLANAGISLHRIFLYCVGGDRLRSQCFMPWAFVPSKDAWDLRVKNQPFFDILRQQVIEANKMGVQVMLCLMNECEERKDDRRAQSPFYWNINGINGLYDDKVLPFISNLTDWILDALDGLNFAVELINEGHRRSSGSADAVNAMLPHLIAADVKPWDISLGADVLDASLVGFGDVSDWKQRWPKELQPPDRENYDIFIDRNHLVKYYDAKYPNATHEVFSAICHNFADKADEEFPDIFPYGRRTGYTIEAWIDRNLSSNRVCFSTDGTDHADAPNGRPSPERMKAAMLYFMRHNPRYKAAALLNGRPKLWFDFLPGRGNTTADIVAVVDAMAEAHKEFFGTWPENRGKVPTYEQTYPEVEPEPQPEPEPVTPQPGFNWRGEWRNNWKWIVGGTVALVVLAILIF